MKKPGPELIKPTADLKEAYLDFLREFRQAGEKIIHGGGPLRTADTEDFDILMQRERDYAAGVNLPEDQVPSATYWLMQDGRILGTCNLRHRLNDRLRLAGGHVGYAVRPSERNKGYATAILRLALAKARELGMDRVLVTCDKDNPASARVIRKCGGALEGEGPNPQDGTVQQRYWIDLGTT